MWNEKDKQEAVRTKEKKGGLLSTLTRTEKKGKGEGTPPAYGRKKKAVSALNGCKGKGECSLRKSQRKGEKRGCHLLYGSPEKRGKEVSLLGCRS